MPLNSHDTQQLNPIQILSALISNVQESLNKGLGDLSSSVSAIRDAVKDLRADVVDLRKTERDLADEVARQSTMLADHAKRIEALEQENRELRSDAVEDRRRASELDLELKAEREAMKSHVRGLEQVVDGFRKQLEETQNAVSATQLEVGKSNEALGAVVDELGIENRVALGRDPAPNEKVEPAFAKLEKRARSSTIVQAVIAVAVIIDAVMHSSLWTHLFR